MKKTSISILFLAFVLAVLPVSALPQRPDPPRLVNDLAGMFSSSQVDELERTLVVFDDSTSNQIAVVTVSDLEGYAPSEYATRIGLEWQVGSAKFDNGLVVLIKPKTRQSSGQVFIAVGYGLEGAIPDAYAKRIIENVMIPHFKSGNYYSGTKEACNVLMKLASGEISSPRENEEEDPVWMVFGIFFIIFLVIFILALLFGEDNNNHRGNRGRRTIYMGPVITSGRNYGGSSFGGGFGGFGGFGGGSFGGGGAGGSW